METRELDLSDQAWAQSEIYKLVKSESNDSQTSQQPQQGDGERSCPSQSRFSSSSTNEQNPTSDKDADNVDKSKQKPEPDQLPIIIGNLDQYRGLSTLQELANTARAAISIGGKEKGNVYHHNILTEPLNSKSLTSNSDIFFGSIKFTTYKNADESAGSGVPVDQLSPNREELPSGPLTRGARKTLEAALARSLDRVPSTTALSREESSSPTQPPLVAVVSSSAPCSGSTTNSGYVHHKPLTSPLSSSLPTASQCSSAAPTLSSPLPPSLFDMSSSFFSSHTCPHPEDNYEGERARGNRSPSGWPGCGKVSIDDGLDDHDDMVNFITDAMGSSVCANIDDDDKNASDSEWTMDSNDASSPTPPTSEMAELKTPRTTPVAVSRSNPSLGCEQSDGLACLLITGDKEDGHLKHDIQEALHTTCVTVRTASLEESMLMCNREAFDLVWVRIAVPVKEELLAVVASIRCSSGKSKGARIIAVADKALLVELLLRLFDDVFLEPLPVMTIRHKYAALYKNKQLSAHLPDTDKTPRDLNTPESSLSLRSTKSQSTPSDSGMDFSDLALPPIKTLPHLTHQTTSTATYSKSPPGAGSPPSPSWCKVEHANKEKQRRVRIKDSCDQLRKLLPYVRGRKTDMASILELTVDYLQIINVSLPAEFQTRVIDMLSHDVPLLEGRMKNSDSVSTTKGKTKLMEPVSLSKSIYASAKSSEGHTSASIITSNNLNNTNKNMNSNGNNSIAGSSIITTRMMTRSQASKSLPDNNKKEGPCSTGGVVQDKTQSKMFDTIFAVKARSDSNANTLNASEIDIKPDNFITKPFHKRELPLNANLLCSNPKRPHMVLTKTKDNQTPTTHLQAGSIETARGKSDAVFESASNQAHRLSSINFPHMFTEGDISANRMFSTGHVSGSDVYPYQPHPHLSTPLPARFPGFTCDGGEIVASVNNTFFDAAYYYYPSLQDSSNGNYFVNNGSSTDYVNPNAVLPVTSNSTSRITNFNLGRRYERVSVSGESERFSETTIGSVSLHQHQHQHQQL
ncbi:hypothetical protein EGW08_017702 [Elysia chlorotica]|uniref:BHLH domain-containing protein n=1 Tax=Elysia chlorotica TaxID=188477 RepID=A0A433SZD8_ELYCH|nr:hypothetical protein EGW08_017702 [Elysia chlorotica]